MLRFTETQVSEFQNIEDERTVQKVADYLRRTAHPDDPPVSDVELQQIARSSCQRGWDLGIRRRDTLCLFAFLVRETGGEALTAPEVEEALRTPGADPHLVLDDAIEVMKILAESET